MRDSSLAQELRTQADLVWIAASPSLENSNSHYYFFFLWCLHADYLHGLLLPVLLYDVSITTITTVTALNGKATFSSLVKRSAKENRCFILKEILLFSPWLAVDKK